MRPSGPLNAIIMISKLPNSYSRFPPDTALESNAGAADGFNLSESFCCRFAADAASGNSSLNYLLRPTRKLDVHFCGKDELNGPTRSEASLQGIVTPREGGVQACPWQGTGGASPRSVPLASRGLRE